MISRRRDLVLLTLAVPVAVSCNAERAAPAPITSSSESAASGSPKTGRCTADGPLLPLSPLASPLWRRLDRACDGGDLEACVRLGDERFFGAGGKRDSASGLATLLGACDHGSGRACSDAARAFVKGNGAPRSMECTEEFLAKGCELGDDNGCIELGHRLDHGDAVHYDPERARALIARARGDAGKCETEHQPTKYTIEACDDGDYFACSHFSFRDNDARVLPRLVKACLAGSHHACWRYPHEEKDRGNAIATLKLGCEQGSIPACVEAFHPKHGLAKPWPLSPEARTALLEVACKNGYGRACTDLGEAASDPAAAVEFFARGCPAKRSRDEHERDGAACWHLADAYRRGNGVAREPLRAAELYRQGCFESEWRDERACIALAEMYETGDGVARDRARFENLMAGLCTVGSTACRGFTNCGSFGFCPAKGLFEP